MNEPAASAASWQAVHSRPAKAQRRDPRKSKRGAFSRRLSRAQWSRGGEAAHAEGATIVGVFGGGGEQRRVSAAAGCVTGGAEEVAATQSKIHPANSPASSRVRPLARPSHPAIPPRLIKTRGPPPYTPRPRPRTARGPRACAAGCRAVRPFSNGRQGGAPSFAAATPCMQNASPLHGSSGEPGTGRPHARHRERLRLRGGGRGKQTRTRRTSGKNTAPARAPSRRDRHALLGMCQALAQSQGARAPPNPLVATRAGGGDSFSNARQHQKDLPHVPLFCAGATAAVAVAPAAASAASIIERAMASSRSTWAPAFVAGRSYHQDKHSSGTTCLSVSTSCSNQSTPSWVARWAGGKSFCGKVIADRCVLHVRCARRERARVDAQKRLGIVHKPCRAKQTCSLLIDGLHPHAANALRPPRE